MTKESHVDTVFVRNPKGADVPKEHDQIPAAGTEVFGRPVPVSICYKKRRRMRLLVGVAARVQVLYAGQQIRETLQRSTDRTLGWEVGEDVAELERERLDLPRSIHL